MARLTESERQELLQLAASEALRRDMEYLASHRHNPVIVDGKVDMDRLLDFLNQMAEFTNHARRPFVRMVERVMKL